LRHGIDQLLRDGHRLRLPQRQVTNNQGEFVTAQTGQCVARAYACQPPVGRRPQYKVTRFVPELIVHRFELVQIHEQQGYMFDPPRRARERSFGQLLKEQMPVCQPGERVVVGLVKHHLRGIFELRDVVVQGNALVRPRHQRHKRC
jgi:hypothetical protein